MRFSQIKVETKTEEGFLSRSAEFGLESAAQCQLPPVNRGKPGKVRRDESRSCRRRAV